MTAVGILRRLFPYRRDEIRRIRERRSLLWTFVYRELRGRYTGSIMGFFWSVIHPLLTILLYILVFSVIIKVKFGREGSTTEYGIFLFAGMLPWLPFQEGLQNAVRVMLENASVIKKITFPRILLPIQVLITSFFNEVIALIIFTGVLFVFQRAPGWSMLLLPVIFLFQLMFTLGFLLAVSCLNLFFRDIGQAVLALTTFWFFGTPIVYPIELVPQWLLPAILANPLTHLVNAYRAVLLHNQLPSLGGSIYFIICAIFVFAVGYDIFDRTRKEIADLI